MALPAARICDITCKKYKKINRPDPRLIVTEPSELDIATRDSLRSVGWGLCHIEMPDFMKTGTIPQYTLSYSKLFVWNMTSYKAVLWLDSDCLVVRSLHPVLARANRSNEKC